MFQSNFSFWEALSKNISIRVAGSTSLSEKWLRVFAEPGIPKAESLHVFVAISVVGHISSNASRQRWLRSTGSHGDVRVFSSFAIPFPWNLLVSAQSPSQSSPFRFLTFESFPRSLHLYHFYWQKEVKIGTELHREINASESKDIACFFFISLIHCCSSLLRKYNINYNHIKIVSYYFIYIKIVFKLNFLKV